eukprot:6289877-Amphidinium_carterae.1
MVPKKGPPQAKGQQPAKGPPAAAPQLVTAYTSMPIRTGSPPPPPPKPSASSSSSAAAVGPPPPPPKPMPPPPPPPEGQVVNAEAETVFICDVPWDNRNVSEVVSGTTCFGRQPYTGSTMEGRKERPISCQRYKVSGGLLVQSARTTPEREGRDRKDCPAVEESFLVCKWEPEPRYPSGICPWCGDAALSHPEVGKTISKRKGLTCGKTPERGLV